MLTLPVMRRFFAVFTLLVALGSGIGCDSASTRASSKSEASGEITNYFGVGEVRSLGTDGKSVVVKHEAFTNFMEAMTMPFPVRDTKELQGLKPGDRITFRLRVTATDGWIDQIQPARTTNSSANPLPTSIPDATNFPAPPPEVRQVPVVAVLNPGDLMPNYTLTNQLGQSFELSSLRGQVVVLDFIFTRCPFPDFCPRLSRNLAALQRRLKESPPLLTNCHLVSLSFDPRYDTQERLVNYGRTYGNDPALWSLCQASMDTIERLAGHFELYFARDVEPAQQNHNLRTVVLDRQGKLTKVFKGNQWTADELAEAVVAAGGDRR
jgi:protein SCO1